MLYTKRSDGSSLDRLFCRQFRWSGPSRRWIGALVFLLAAGCNPPDRGGGVPVSGIVTWNGDRLGEGTVSFLNQDGVTVAIGIIKGGKYSLDQSASYHGVPPGSYKVTVMSWIVRPGAQLPNGSMSHEGVSRIPRSYTDPATSGFTAEVGKSGGKIDFAVQGDGEKLP